MSIPQLTTLLPNDLLARLERLRVNPRKRKTNRTQGEHLSGKGGTSIEFSDYRITSRVTICGMSTGTSSRVSISPI